MATDLKKYGPWALITGGSEGVGAEAARQLAADGFKLVLVARKPEPLEALKAELEAKGTEVRIKSVDLSACRRARSGALGHRRHRDRPHVLQCRGELGARRFRRA
jgi:short-subunit dehydrogenase